MPSPSPRRLLPALLFLSLIFTPLVRAQEKPPTGQPPEKKRPSGEELEHALNQALNALAESMQTLSRLVEESQEKFKKCQSGESKEEWCLKMRDALERLERLERSMQKPRQDVLP
jgi:hypothetical protein